MNKQLNAIFLILMISLFVVVQNINLTKTKIHNSSSNLSKSPLVNFAVGFIEDLGGSSGVLSACFPGQWKTTTTDGENDLNQGLTNINSTLGKIVKGIGNSC